MTIPKVGGRPKKWKTVEELQEQIDDYFKSCYRKKQFKQIEKDEDGNKFIVYVDEKDKDGEPIYERIRPFTITGLAVHLNTTRKVLLDYENSGQEEFRNTIKRAKQIIENYTEESLHTGSNVAGIIFNLKNNYGWVDKKEVDNHHTGRIDHEHSQNIENMKEITQIKDNYEAKLRKIYEEKPPQLENKE